MPRISKITQSQWDELAQKALIARRKAYAPYSRFKVGAALLLDNEEIVCGSNVENASYGLCMCAERNAVATAISQGKNKFVALAIASGKADPAPPCGMCRQVLVEFCTDLEIMLLNSTGTKKRTTLSKLLPHPFRWKGAT
ncbi:MAG: cytidine deaminase [Pseudomonadota bacterium]